MRSNTKFGPTPVLGVEFETVAWRTSLKSCVDELESIGYLPPGYVTIHRYHCDCRPCMLVGNEFSDVLKWKVEYDASLPLDGAEFISSIFPANDFFISQAAEALNIISENSIWTLGKINRNGTNAEPGMHVHASAELTSDNYVTFVRTFLQLAPEFYIISSATGKVRSLTYRRPMFENNHHDFINLSRRNGGQPHLEFRMFEADYDNPDFVEECLYLVAGLVQACQEPDIMTAVSSLVLMRQKQEIDYSEMTEAKEIMEHGDATRINFLIDIAKNCSSIQYDEGESEKLENLRRRTNRWMEENNVG